MDYKNIRKNIEQMANENYEDFIKALVSYEKGINDEKALDEIYQSYMDNDTQGLLSDEFDYLIDEMREQGLINEQSGVEKERDDLINIVGNITKDIEVLNLKNNQGEEFKVVNFSVVVNDDKGDKIYHNCSAYEDKTKIPETFNKGDFVKLFGQVRKNIDENGKEHINVRILDSKLLKAIDIDKGKSQEENKKSILEQIKSYKESEKSTGNKKIEQKKENER